MHIRTLIRNAAAATLADATAAGANVFPGRLSPLQASELPALKIYTPDDSSSPREAGPNGRRRRTVTLLIEVVVAKDELAGEDEMFDRLDDLAGEAEARIDADPTLGGIAADVSLESSAFSGGDTEGSVPVGVMSLTFSVDTDSAGAALRSGRASIVNAGGVAVGRLRSWSIETAGDPGATTNALSDWETVNERFTPGWSATLELTLDDADEGQAKLAVRNRMPLQFYPRGVDAPGREGEAVVSAVEDTITEEGDVIRTVTLIGSGALSPLGPPTP